MNKPPAIITKSFVSCLVLVVLQSVGFVPDAISAKLAASDIRQNVEQTLDREGYLGKFRNGQDLQRGLSAYLWDNRNWLKTPDIHNSRKIDAVVCLLHEKGYPGFAEYLSAELGKNGCEQIVQRP